MSMDGKVTAYSTRTGQATRVPPHYLTNPALSGRWSATPVIGTNDQAPSQSWSNDRIRSWADDHGITLDEGATKAEMLAVIDGTPNDVGTPAGGDTSDGTPPAGHNPA